MRPLALARAYWWQNSPVVADGGHRPRDGSPMPYRKGELSPAEIDRGWPHQVALPATVSQGDGWQAIDAFCRDLSRCPRGHSVFHENQWWNVYCFAEAADAEKFRLRFGGEPFNPKHRGRGANWARWKKP
jgi:hypothetical protein